MQLVGQQAARHGAESGMARQKQEAPSCRSMPCAFQLEPCVS